MNYRGVSIFIQSPTAGLTSGRVVQLQPSYVDTLSFQAYDHQGRP